MKERIVLEIPKDMCDNCNGCDKPTSAQIECYLEEPRQLYETVKVPETWEELKELCRKLKLDSEVYITLQLTDKVKFYFYDNGEIIGAYTDYEYEFSLAKNRTPAQMWEMIKNLIGNK